MSNIRLTYSGLISFSLLLVSIITGLIFTVIVTRRLEPSDFGLWSLIGGIIAYFAIRRDDPQKAKKGLWVGIFLTVINIIVQISLFSTGTFEQDYSVNL